jgi:hypothetical protein
MNMSVFGSRCLSILSRLVRIVCSVPRHGWHFLLRHPADSISVTVFAVVCWSWLLAGGIAGIAPNIVLGTIIAVGIFLLNCALTIFVLVGALRIIRYIIRRHTPFALGVLAVIGIWALGELLVAWFVNLTYFGPGTRLDSVFPFASVGLIAMGTPIGFLARLTGLFGLSGVIVALIIVVAVPGWRRWAVGYYAVVLLCTLGCYYGYAHSNGKHITVAAQAAVNYDKSKTVQPLGLEQPVDIAVTPEYSLDYAEDEAAVRKLAASAGPGAHLVGSRHMKQDRKFYNTLMVATAQRIEFAQQKYRTIPGGEYLPYWARGMFLIAGMGQLLNSYDQVNAIAPGAHPIHPVDLGNGVGLGAQVCSSMMSPADFEHMVQGGATVLSNSSALQDIASAPMFELAYRNLILFDAVANARPFIQSSVDADALVVDSNGHIVARAPAGHTAVARITTNKRITPYTLAGEWLVWLGVGALIYLFLTRSKIDA